MTVANALPALLALVACGFAANAARLFWGWCRAVFGGGQGSATMDDVFVNASTAFLFFTLTLVALT